MSDHEKNAEALLRQAQTMIHSSPEKAQVLATMAAAEATLAQADQQRLCNETTMYAEAAYEATDSRGSDLALNPTDMSVRDWAEDLYDRIRGEGQDEVEEAQPQEARRHR